MTYPYGVHVAVARVDRETGGVAIERYVVAYDVGRAVNPMLIEGQIAGGVAQGLGGAGTVQGVVKDQTGAVMVSVMVEMANPLTGFRRSAVTDATGRFVFRNIPPNPYHITVTAQGFQTLERDIDVRTAVPIELDVRQGSGTEEGLSGVTSNLSQ